MLTSGGGGRAYLIEAGPTMPTGIAAAAEFTAEESEGGIELAWSVPPSTAPRLQEMIRMIAQLGGYIDRPRADDPGPQTVGLGMQRMYDITRCWRLFGPDTRAQKVARARGVDLADLRARQVADADFVNFDLILAMDRGHMRDLERARPDDATSKIGLFLDYAPNLGVSDLPDPYFGDDAGFETVLDLIETAGRGLLANIRDDLR